MGFGSAPEYGTVATIGGVDDRTAYDGLYDPSAARFLLSLIDDSAVVGDSRSTKNPTSSLPVDAAPGVRRRAEQHQRGLRRGGHLQAFRRVSAGINPDIESEPGTRLGRKPMWQSFWDPFGGCGKTMPSLWAWSPRTRRTPPRGGRWPPPAPATLFAEGDLYAYEVGGDFAGSPTGSVRRSHRCTRAGLELGAPDEHAAGRGHAAAPGDRRRPCVAELVQYAGRSRERYAKLATRPVTVQRVHGDLHLGQVLRTPEAGC